MNRGTNSFLKPISAEAMSKHGYNAHGVIMDELHTQKDSELLDVLMTSQGARRQPITVMMTTADYVRESICNEKYQYAKSILEGTNLDDNAFLPCIYEADIDDDWTSPEVWAKANPNFGVSVKHEFLERESMKAKQSNAYQNTFMRLFLNIQTQQDVRFLMLDQWRACKGDKKPEILKGKRCFGGLDLASTSDLCSLALYFPDEKACLSFNWVPELTAKGRREKNKIGYLKWAGEGFLELTEGNVADYDHLRNRINEIGAIYNIEEIAIDRWNSTQLQIQLMGDGFDVVPFGQGFASMTAPTKELERMVRSGELIHFGNPVLDWCASNVAVEIDSAGNLKPSKKKSTEKIDAIVSLVMAIGRAMNDEGPKKSVYETRGIMVI